MIITSDVPSECGQTDGDDQFDRLFHISQKSYTDQD